MCGTVASRTCLLAYLCIHICALCFASRVVTGCAVHVKDHWSTYSLELIGVLYILYVCMSSMKWSRQQYIIAYQTILITVCTFCNNMIVPFMFV